MDRMPQISINDEVLLSYHRIGSGEPLVFVAGLGMDHLCWLYQIPFFQQYFDVIVFDNRGMGQSSLGSGAYSIEMMADDLAVLLQKLGIKKSHIIGSSMGGMIAQQYAINYPERVNKLLLCSTFAKYKPFFNLINNNIRELFSFNGNTLFSLQANHFSFPSFFDFFIQQIFSSDFLSINDELVKYTLKQYLSTETYVQTFLKQLHAIYHHDTLDRLHHIVAETLVLTGADDLLVPVACSTTLAQHIPHTTLQIIKNQGHVFHIEQPDLFNTCIIDFLK